MAANSSFDHGDVVRATATFTNSSGTAIDPTSVFCKYKSPNGKVTALQYGVDAALVKSSTGIYYVNVNCNATGTWFIRFYSTGTGQAAEEDEFYVERTHF